MRTNKKICLLGSLCILAHFISNAQLLIVPEFNAQALAQKLVGPGVAISNVTLVGDPRNTAIFYNQFGPLIGIDSGIVLTNGRAKSPPFPPLPISWGLDADGFNQAALLNANLAIGLPGDVDLAATIGVPVGDTHDACVLEFDFIPQGDSIKFKYVFSSEEYVPAFVCDFNDAFAFLISGPGITGLKNIALIPNTNTPVSIFNVNNVRGGACPNNTAYYVDNSSNTYFTHDGHTVVLTALERVVSCQTYHLKLVIADVGDFSYDSGVFLEAGSLTSPAVELDNQTQTDNEGNSYLVEGCAVGSFKITRPNVSPTPLIVNLAYGGTAVNGVDVQLLPASVIIPGNETEVIVDVLPIVDLLPEGIETLIIYALAGCTVGLPSDSAIIQVRDYDSLAITPPDTSYACRNGAVQLTASTGYSTYVWDPDPTLSSTIIRNPIATPVSEPATYYCTATEGFCNARDSVTLKWKKLFFFSKEDVICKDATTGKITFYSGPGWVGPVMFSIDNGPLQPTGLFTNLPAGVHRIKIIDATGCVDSSDVTITQLFPDLLISNTAITAAGCSGNADGTITITASGGNAPYLYSIDGLNYQPGNFFNIRSGNQIITVSDNNNCITSQNVIIPLNNTVTLVAGVDATICEGKNYQLNPNSNGTSFVWTPAASLSDPNIINPVASPVISTKYFVEATTGICSRIDSIMVFVNPAPVPDAGLNKTICYNTNYRLNGSGGVSFLWTPATFLDDQTIYNPLVMQLTGPITYYLSVIDAKGCNSLKDDSVLISVTTAPVLNVGPDTTIAIRQPLLLFARDVNNTGFDNWTWSPTYGLNNPFAANPIAILDRDIIYYVSASSPTGCLVYDTIKIKAFQGPELYVPNAFTPNGNSLNDILKVIPIGMKEFHFFRIYNRYGQLVFFTTNPYIGWDGTLKGKLQNAGTYVWMAEAIDYRGNLIQSNGTVMLIQ